MKIIATSDLHGTRPIIPECDLLLVGGDITPLWSHDNRANELAWLRSGFSKWLAEQPAKKVVWVAGNHDFVLDRDGWEPADSLDLPDHVHYLKDELIVLPEDEYRKAIEIWGTPWTPNLPSWAFQAEGNEAKEKFEKMPSACDILLSHGPPYGYGDRVNNSGNFGDRNVGSRELLEVIREKKPRMVVTGHIHEAFGSYIDQESGTSIYNVSHNNERYEAVNPPVEIVINDE